MKQATLGAVGVKRFVMHMGEKVQVEMPLRFVETYNHNCQHCGKGFKQPSGLATHVKLVHGNADSGGSSTAVATTANKRNKSVIPKINSTNLLNEDDVEIVNHRIDLVKLECRDILQNIIEKVEGRIAKSDGAKKLAGKKRHSYSAIYKADAIHECTEEGSTQAAVAAKYGISQDMLSRWISKKSEIISQAADKARKLFKKGRKSTKYKELYKKLFEKFKHARARGQQVTFPWLWSKARVIQQTLDPDAPIKNHVIVRFLRSHHIRLRAKQRSKNRSKSSMIPDLKKWHATYRERCIRSNSHALDFDEKWGAFKPSERLNVDQSPLPFVINVKKTYDYVEPGKSKEHNTWISQPGSGLEKRQCSLQVMIRGDGKQPRLAVVFRGKGNVKPHERLAWHPKVEVYFQANAWMDTETCLKWAKNTLRKFTEEENLSKFLLLCDNLEAQTSAQFKEYISSLSGLVWYGLKNGTDLWQVVDAGIAQMLKVLTGIEHNEWLDQDDNADRWFSHENKFTASERRILITHWTGDAWEKLISSPKYESFIKKCWQKTGCLITANGSDDKLIKPEGLTDYIVPPPAICDPSPQPAVTNTLSTTVSLDDDDEEEEISLGVDDELVEEEDLGEDEHSRVFDFIDRLMIEAE